MTARFWILIVLIIVLIVGSVFLIPRLEGTPPTISELPSLEIGHAPQTLVVDVGDENSGLRTVELRVLSANGSKTLAERHFPGSMAVGGDARSERIEVELDVGKLGLPEGESTLVVVARDWSLRDGLGGNSAELSVPFNVDTKPPSLRVQSGLTYIYRGGSGAVTYTIGEDAPEHGVRVGDSFFQGHPLPSGDAADRVAIFAIPVNAPAEPKVRVVARDAAGNESASGFALRIFERQFTDSSIALSKGFLNNKVLPLAETHRIAADDLGDSFKAVNETLRGQNEARIREVITATGSQQRWQGAFEQMENSKVTSRFAEKRTYLWEDRPISKAVHYGFDLASTRGAPITAANDGVVLLAEDLGIYGQCVIIDHGLGVHSLYGHLSQMDVAAGDTVAKSQLLGRSGATGLAGGDHLHFAILVGGEYVDPLEWWDPKWVRSHVESRLSGTESPSE